MESVVDRHAFCISDDTAIAAEVLGHAVMSRFPIATSSVILPSVENISHAWVVKKQVDAIYQQASIRPLVFYPVIIPEIRDIILQSEGFYQDIVQTLVAPLQQELNLDPTPVVHRAHGLNPGNPTEYDARTTAIDYILTHDDGAFLRNLDQVRVILLGVSYCGKTPTSLYLIMQYGIRVASYPFTTDDMDNLVLPAPLKPLQHKMFGLTINPEWSTAIRGERQENSRYAFLCQCRMEVTEVEALHRKDKIPCLNSTNYSVEEIATKIMDVTGPNCRVY